MIDPVQAFPASQNSQSPTSCSQGNCHWDFCSHRRALLILEFCVRHGCILWVSMCLHPLCGKFLVLTQVFLTHYMNTPQLWFSVGSDLHLLCFCAALLEVMVVVVFVFLFQSISLQMPGRGAAELQGRGVFSVLFFFN